MRGGASPAFSAVLQSQELSPPPPKVVGKSPDCRTFQKLLGWGWVSAATNRKLTRMFQYYHKVCSVWKSPQYIMLHKDMYKLTEFFQAYLVSGTKARCRSRARQSWHWGNFSVDTGQMLARKT